VINVNWNDAKAWLSRKTGKTYRLLSEAEREYVARAGTTTPFWWGSPITPKHANYDARFDRLNLPDPYLSNISIGAPDEFRNQTVPIDSFDPNPWGIYNVHGNVWELTHRDASAGSASAGARHALSGHP
jgi:formylglycine-generating enzyme required for sulfatase activity